MTTSIWEIAADTPWWVYVLFVYLIMVGYGATKPRIVPLRSIMILPLVFISLSVLSMYSSMHLSAYTLSLWIGAALLGTALGWIQFRLLKVKAIKNQAKLYMPGTWSLLLIILAIFAVKYYSGYQLAINPQLLSDTHYAVKFIFVYGLITGLFVGRLTYALRCLKAGPYTEENYAK